MGEAFITRRGGKNDGYGFTITSGVKQPAPKEGTIWINTPNKIAGWSFSEKEPIEPYENQIWIRIATFGNNEINLADKKNTILISILGASERIGQSWEEKKIEIYQNQIWKKISSTLFIVQNGAAKINLEASGMKGYYKLDYLGDSIYLHGANEGYGGKRVYNKNGIDVTSYNRIVANVLSSTGVYLKAWQTEPITTNSGNGDTSSPVIASVKSPTSLGTCSLDISAISGKIWIGFEGGHGSNVKFDQLYLTNEPERT